MEIFFQKIVVNDAIFSFCFGIFFIFGVLFFKKSPFKVGKGVNVCSGALHMPNYLGTSKNLRT
jgi:hypothetical protein